MFLYIFNSNKNREIFHYSFYKLELHGFLNLATKPKIFQNFILNVMPEALKYFPL